MTTEKIALVTGANKGIGLEIVRQLAKAGFRVFLTARDRQRGEEASKTLQQDSLSVEFLQLDVADETSIDNWQRNYHPKLTIWMCLLIMRVSTSMHRTHLSLRWNRH